MSLLLEALKKAEKAKEEAERRARAEAASRSGELRLEEESPPSARPVEPKSVLTKAELPDIKQPLEILTDDIRAQEAPPPPAPPAAAPLPKNGTAKAESGASPQAAARAVFEAKFREPNPRMPFYITLATLGVFALGTIGYFWYQLRPRPPLVNPNPPPVAGQPAQVATTRVALQPAGEEPRTGADIPGLPQVPAGKAIGSAPAPAPRAPEASAPTPPRSELASPPSRPRPSPPRRTPVQRSDETKSVVTKLTSSRPGPRVHPKVQSGYDAYLKGDFAAARADYESALKEEPANRDALLGLASIDFRTGRLEAAEARYLRLLQLDPGDPHAQAGLIALRARQLDPVATESRLKNMLASNPEAGVLHFSLGNQLAQQGRWGEAQSEYFKAFAAAPANPDFAYNLAVSLDHLRKEQLALEYYRRALALADGRIASFDVDAARARVAQLER